MGKSSFSTLSVLLLAIALLETSLANEKCSLACKGSPKGASFLSGHKYNYGVEGTVSIFLTGADKQETSVKMLSEVSVTVIGNCEHELKINNLVISGPDGKKYQAPPGIDKPIRFAMQEGRIGAEICAVAGDTRRSLNIKRAIITLLQTEQNTATMVDVFGACPTEASSSQEGAALLVHQTRDLSRCAHREHGKTDLMTAVYNPSAEIKNTQILQSTLHIESKVKAGVPEKVVATEEYLYKPFSVGENGARAKVVTKVTLTGKAKAAAGDSQCTEPRTVIFEAPHGVSPLKNNEKSVLSAIKDAAKTLGTEAGSKSAGLFAQLVRIMRTTNKEDLLSVYGQVKGNNLEKRIFLDGLLRAGTGESIEASITILKNKDLNMFEQQLVYLSLGNAKHVNDDTVKAATSLLDLPDVPKEIYLGVGALAGTYCRDHNCHSGKFAGINALSQKFASKLQNCRPKTKVEEDRVIAVLKGIRNIRHLEDSLIDKLVHCAADHNVKARVRVAALESFHADPCAAKLKKTAIDIMKNRQLDSEIRIKAYIAVIECPCSKSANEIKTLLESEPVHQVGRYITTSLRHIRASANPDKRLARQHYSQISIPSRYFVDDRKYSFYREMSFSAGALGVGGAVEQSVIYSQDSFLPRSAALNLTAEVFGHTVNVMEVGGRQGNLDRVIEHIFGPAGLLRTNSPQKLYDEAVKRFQESSDRVKEGINRGRRSIKTDVDNFDKRVKAESTSFNNELDLDLYLKMFGTDAIFLSFGDDQGFDVNKIIDQVLKYSNQGINDMKHFQQELRAHLLFMDAELSYPTSTGFPLRLDLVGAATARFDVATNIDIRQILRSPENAKVDFKFVPSTDVEVIGIMVVDADAVATGLKVTNNLHSSTGGHLIAKVLENGRGIDIQFGLPIDKQEILTASNDLVLVTAEKGQKSKITPLKVDTERMEYNECFDQLSNMLGLTVCGEISLPFSVSGPEAQASLSKFIARYPLTGPSNIKLYLEKNDLRGYHIKGIFRGDNPEKQGFELLFEAEGSKNRRTSIAGDLINTNEEKTIKLSLESPIKVIGGQISLLMKPNEYVGMVKAKIDANEYYGRAGFNVQGNDKRSVFKPVVEYQLPDEHGKQNLKVDGQLIREVNGPSVKYTFEGVKVIIPSSNEVVDVNGHYSKDAKGMDLDIKAKKGEHNMFVTGMVKGHDVKMEFQNTLNPYINFKLNGHVQFDETIHNDLDLYYSGDLTNPQNRITFNQLLKYKADDKDKFNLITKNKLDVYSIPLKIKFEADIDPKKVDMEIGGQYRERKGEFDLEARSHIKKQGDYSVKVSMEADKQGVEVFSKRDIVSADKSNFENFIQIKNFGKYELSGVVLHKNRPGDVNIGAIGHFKIAVRDKNDDIKFDVGVIENNNLYSSHAKISAKADIIDYLLKITKGANPTGQLKFIVKDAVAANGQFKVTDSDGKGNGMIIVDFKKSQRKIKGDVKFLVKEPIYNADVDIFLNFEKDNNDKVHFSTKSKKTDTLLDSKNKVIYAGKTTEFNIHKVGILEPSGKTSASLEFVLPNERVLTFKTNRDFTIKDDVYNGQGEVVFSDAPKRGAPASTISYKGKAVNCNFEKDEIHYEGQVDLKLHDGKNLMNTFTFKNVPEKDKSKMDFKADLNGNMMPQPAALSASMEYTDIESFQGKTNIHMKGNYGNVIQFEYAGNGEISGIEKGDKKYVDENSLTLKLPFESASDVKVVSNVMYLQPESGDVFLEYSIVESFQIDANTYKVDASGKLGEKSGFCKSKFLVPHAEPLIMDTTYKTDLKGEQKTGSVDMKLQYGKGKTAAISIDGESGPQEQTLHLKTKVPQAEKLKNLDFTVKTKNPSPDTYGAEIIADMDGKVYSTNLQLLYSKAHPMLDLKSTCPTTGKTSRIYMKGSSLSSSQGKLEMKIENIKEYDMDVVAEGSIQKDNVAVKVLANCPKFGFKNYKVDIASKDSGSGKRLEFHATNDNKNVFSGSTSFISKQEGPKTIIEGSGSMKIRDEQKSANFKYIRTLLTEGSEQGIETFLNLAVGERSYVAESRVTNVEYKNSYVYCEEKKQCAHAEFNSKLSVPKPGVFQHLLNIGMDLRKLGFAPEFGLQVSNEISEGRLPQYSMDVHVNKDDKKYHLHVYNQPEHGKFPAGITVTLPHRVLAVELLTTYPTEKGMPFPIEGHLNFYMDKKKPQMKTGLRFLLDVTGSDKQHAAVAEFGYSHPKLGKEAVMKFKGNMMTPDSQTLKIETSASMSHAVLGKDRESKIKLEVTPTLFKFMMDTPIVQIIDIEAKATMKENLQQGDLTFNLLQGKPVQVRMLAKDFNYFEFTTGYKDESERKLSIISHIQPEKRVDISADIVLPGEKKNIVHGALFLHENLVKSDYGISKENFNYFVNALKKDLDTLESRVKQIGEKTNKEFKDVTQRIGPKFKELDRAYREDLQKLWKEMSDDQVLKEISEALHVAVQFMAKIIDDVITTTKPIFDKITDTFTDIAEKVEEMYEKQIAPLVKQLYDNVGTLIKEYMDGLIDVVAHFAAIVTDFFEKHKPELQELMNTLTEIFKDLTRIIVTQLKEIREKGSQVFMEFVHQLKELPFVEFIKEKFQDLAVPEQVLAVMQDLHNTLRSIMPTEDVKEFADAFNGYVMKKLRQEKTDDIKELRVLYDKFSAAAISVLQFVRMQLGQYGVPSLVYVNPLQFFSGPQNYPTFGGAFSFSGFNQIMQGDIPDPLAVFNAYRPKSESYAEEYPNRLRAVMVDGQHLFTFDGRHLTFPGDCRYILAHDHVDRNFTLYVQLVKGAAKALGIVDKFGTTIEIKDNGQVTVNGAARNFPVFENDGYAFRVAAGRVGIASMQGVIAFCTPTLDACYFKISGYYLGKLRGLFGDGNNEPYDDFTLPNGKITTSESEFGNAFKMSSSCPNVKTPEHSHHQMHEPLPSACEQVFGGLSPIRALRMFLDVTPYRQACIHAVANLSPEEALKHACRLGGGYVAMAFTSNLPGFMPPVCLRCTDTDTPKNYGELYEFKLPTNKADLIFAVETTKPTEIYYKQVLVPFVQQFIDSLKAKQFTDIVVHLVGVTSRSPYLEVYDTDLKLKNPKVRFDADHRYKRTPLVKTGFPKFDELEAQFLSFVDDMKIKFGQTNIIAGYGRIGEISLRPDAVKHTITLVGEHCIPPFSLFQKMHALSISQTFAQMALTQSVITITPNLVIGGGKPVEQVVGFSKDNVLMLGDKKKTKESEALRSTLLYPDDSCINFIEDVGGYAFSATNYMALEAGQQKQFIQTAVNAIITEMSSTSYVQQCACTYFDPWTLRSVCVNKEKKEIARRRK